jgi:Peptidase family C25
MGEIRTLRAKPPAGGLVSAGSLVKQRRLLLAAPRGCMYHLQPLVRAWRSVGVHVERLPFDAVLPDLESRLKARDDLDAVLLVGPARRAPATVLTAPFVIDRGNRRVPIGWLPATDAMSLRRFAATAARVHRRGGNEPGVALLSQWDPQYLHVVDRMESLLRDHLPTFRWTSDVITREGLVDAMGSGLGLGVYVGHGRPVGWVGYHGMRRHHFDSFVGEPMGAVLSLCCRTASRRRTGLSYSEALPLLGVAAASFGATSDTLHTDNTRWAVALCDVLTEGVTTVGELLVRSAPRLCGVVSPYRLIGDPLAPLAAAPTAFLQANAVRVYP